MIIHRWISAPLVIAALPLFLAGCEGNDAEQAVKDVAGVEEGSATRTADINEKTYTVEEETRIRDAQTGELVGREISRTDVTVQEETQVKQEVEVKSSETTTQTEGYVPDSLSDQ